MIIEHIDLDLCHHQVKTLKKDQTQSQTRIFVDFPRIPNRLHIMRTLVDEQVKYESFQNGFVNEFIELNYKIKRT